MDTRQFQHTRLNNYTSIYLQLLSNVKSLFRILLTNRHHPIIPGIKMITTDGDNNEN